MTTFHKIIFALLLPLTLRAQQGDAGLTQKVHGQVLDAASRQPLPGVIILLLGNTQMNTVTDANGYYSLAGVPLGRQSFAFSFVGYEPYNAAEVAVISGKELELNVSLKESLRELQEVTVSAGKDRARPINEFAQLSARSFSVEETRRYAASFADPARMVMNFPGVSNAGDGNNSIVVRGNSPKGVLWRLEGIEIPNPNHFGSLGASGGAISMLNANTLGTSDFYTGAFPAEIGNALSGAFDLTLRNGNTERREHTIQVGTLGMELATEGPLSKGSKASYLLNYRYSTLALIGGFLDLGGVVPNYQDASFKINMPTAHAGSFSVFGLGGYNKAIHTAKPDSSEWDNEDEGNYSFVSKNKMAVAGITHQYFLSKGAYLRTVLSGSYDNTKDNEDTLNPDGYRAVPVQHTSFTNTALRLSVLYNQKINAQHSFRTGFVGQQLGYDLNFRYYNDHENTWKNVLSGNGNTQFYQAYLQWKYRATNRLTFTGGVHGSHFALNGKSSIEPRLSAAYEVRRQRYTVAAGLHSKPEHISIYLFENTPERSNDPTFQHYPNKSLDILRAFHAVAGWGTGWGRWRLKAEVYYQHLYNIPVGQDSNTSFSMLNAESIYSLMALQKPLVSKGTGNNYGIDLSIERPFSNSYYFIVTGSLYRSTYKDYFGNEYNTRFNRGYQANLIGGKEFRLSANGKKVLGVNGKILASGGMRQSRIDLQASVASGETEIVAGQYFTQQTAPYFRADASVYLKRNRPHATHTIQLDVQNISNRQNIYDSYFDAKTGTVKKENQLGILPNLSYRIDFRW